MKSFFTLLAACFSFAAFSQSGEMEFTSSGTFTVPAGVTSLFMEVVGAGGSGGYNGTGGGGGGGYSSGIYSVTPGSELIIYVGTAGVDAATGTTEVDGFLMATGGENGVSVPNPEIGGGGNGGVSYGGNISNYFGGQGGGGYYTYFGGGGGGAAGPSGNGGFGGNTIAWTGICNTPGGDAGAGGGGPSGDGGKGAGFTDDFCNLTDPAGNGVNYGGGGGGGNGNGGGPGAGANGYCRISWCAVDVTTSLSEETITANAADASYQWIDCTTSGPIDGEINQSFTATVNGLYAVIVNDGLCSDTSECVEISTIIEQGIENAFNYKVYVNPFSDHILLMNTIGDEEYYLMNATGQLMWTGMLIQQQDFSFLPQGIYLLRIKQGDAVATLQLIKQ